MSVPESPGRLIRISDQYYILAAQSSADETTRVLKHADTFLVTDRHGDIRPLGFESHGLFHNGTRFLSHFTIRLDGKRPLLLSSTVTEDNAQLMVDLTNPDFESQDGKTIRRGTIHIHRSIFLWDGRCYEHIRITNFELHPIEFECAFEFDADFKDIFEVRGVKREKRGDRLAPQIEADSVVLAYRGLDGVVRKTRLDFAPAVRKLDENRAGFLVKLESHQEMSCYVTITCETGERRPAPGISFDRALAEVKNSYRQLRQEICVIETSNEQFNDWLNRSRADLFMMLTRTPHGVYPYAGIPWYNTVFGRDGIITAMETLWWYPEIARGVLNFLAANQADSLVPEQDAEPGKILHELRNGEMAALKEIPFGRYYGTVDATPLFVMLAGEYYERTGDMDFIRRLWPHIERALDWIDEYGDVDGDGFVEYTRRSTDGLSNQGWKDSWDSVFHADGSLAQPPIALCEVQGYVYQAKLKAARLAQLLDKKKTAGRLFDEAEQLQAKFLKKFWCPDIASYVIALDGNKQPCRVKSSNAGHCLFTGIADKEHARAIVRGLMDKSFFTEWGIRTIAASQARYNPMSYHNGSVWPHDNALIAYGMERYGFKDGVIKILTGLFDASIFLDLHRLPELFCGFHRRKGEGPTLYPVACDPQSWASGAVFLLLQACLGLSIQGHKQQIHFNNPTLPPFLEKVNIRNLKVGSAVIDMTFHRHQMDVTLNVTRKVGDVKVLISK
jgi:glycogen debranching enzyme